LTIKKEKKMAKIIISTDNVADYFGKQMEEKNIPDLGKNQILVIWSVASQFTN
jgi:hypothetical protein